MPKEKRPPKKDRENGDEEKFVAAAVVLFSVVMDEDVLFSDASLLGLGDLEMDLDADGVNRDPGDDSDDRLLFELLSGTLLLK